jgi:ABC-2 type transport system permease protein
VEDRQVAAAVIIPAGFSDSVIPPGSDGITGPLRAIEVYVDPSRPVSAGVIRSVVESFLSQVEASRTSGQVGVQQLLAHGLLAPAQAAQAGQEIAALPAAAPISLHSTSATAGATELDVLAFFAPGMAMLFLMYTVTQGGRSILAERQDGTLARLLATPTSTGQVLGGKVLGIFLTGVAQVGVLVAASSLLFGLKWGDPAAVVVLILAVAAAATGWGILLAAIVRTPAQVSSLGSALMLLFAMLGGTFISTAGFPAWLRTVSRITPNAWGLDAFSQLGRGAKLVDIGTPVLALVIMAAALFAAALVVARRGALAQR